LVRFLEEKLRLRVNRDKSAVAPVGERKFLGHRLLLNGKLGISPKSLQRAKEKIRQITSRSQGVSFAQVIVDLNSFLVGWLLYYRLAAFSGDLQRLDAWIRRRLRCFRLKQRKGGRSITEFLRRLGIPPYEAARIGSSGKGWWRLANSPPVKKALSNEWFSTQGLVSLALKHAALRTQETAVYV